MSDDNVGGEETRQLPKGCRIAVNEKGEKEIKCSEDAPRELKPEPRGGALFKNTPVQYENLRCKKDRRDGKMHCSADFTADELPNDMSA